jgi:hypothetical protein
MSKRRARSSFLVFLMLSSVLIALVGPATPVMANNETTAGTITTSETWSGTHQLTGDVTIASGAKLIINPGTTVIFPNGTYLDVRGNICAGVSSCGASGDASIANKITLRWTDPSNSSAIGECKGMMQGTQEIQIEDASCFEGMLIRSSIDLSETGFRHITIDDAWGIPYYIDSINRWRYGAMVIDGASPTLTQMRFTNINTSSVLTTNLAQPTFEGGTYVAGNDDKSGVGGSAVQIYGSGTQISPLVMNSPFFIGTDNGCGNNDGGRPTLWAEGTFIEINDATVNTGDYGFSLTSSSGLITNSDINVNCNGIDINGIKAVQGVEFTIEIGNNEITTDTGTGITAYDGANVELHNNEISGVGDRSGITVQSSKAYIHHNDIGPIGGWNGLWLTGTFDVIAEYNTISETAKTPIQVGEPSSSGPAPSASRLHFSNNTVSVNSPGTCSSFKYWGGEYTCPAVSLFRSGVTLYDNEFSMGGDADGIRAIGGLLDVQRNLFNTPGTGAVIRNYDSGFANTQQYGSLGFFSLNTWNGVETAYNVTKSSVTVQSEFIPSSPPGNFPVILDWPDQEAWPANGFQGSIMPTQISECASCTNLTPINFPLAISMDNNSTVFTFANLSNVDTSKIFIKSQPTQYAVQVRRAEMVRFQTLVDGMKVENTNVLIEDALGNDLYSLYTDQDGYTPWFALASDSHLDFRGLAGGDNPDGFADDEYEDSCSDGIDNDGDLTIDDDDLDCDYTAGTRELSRYYYTAYRFGFGYARSDFVIQDVTYQDTINLLNSGPSVSVVQNNGHSFRKIVNFTGSAHDGQLAGFYATDSLAQWDQKGYIHSIEVRDPFTSEWESAGLGVDDSGAEPGTVTRFNHPFNSWHYSFDMSNYQEMDYTFEFRSFDGIDYSPIISRTIKLNAAPPVISISSPSDGSTWSDGSVTFEGTAYDQYGCPIDCSNDIGEIYFYISGPNFEGTTPTSGGADWSWTWDFSGQPRTSAEYTFTIWASDSDFCLSVIDECDAVTMTLTIDNSNSIPFISLLSPQDGERLSVSDTTINGVARDNDGSVSRVDITVRDIYNGGIIVHQQSVTDFEDNGAWSTDWDPTILQHDFEYAIDIMSYDGYDFSQMSTITITADNPSDAGNNQPSFNSDGWSQEIVLYCEISSQSQDRCTKGEIDLNQFFSDLDSGQDLILSVYDDPNDDSDDNNALVINVGQDGIGIYDPISMFFYDSDMSTWTLENVIFVATDPFGSKEISIPVTFRVIGVTFEIYNPEVTVIQDGEMIFFSGIGLPGRTVEVLIKNSPVNLTIVNADSSWEVGIASSRFSDGPVTPVFKFGDEYYESSVKISVGDSDDGLSKLLWLAIISILTLGLLGAAFVYFFVEIDDGENTDDSSETIEESEGWIWDESSNDWIEDPDYES